MALQFVSRDAIWTYLAARIDGTGDSAAESDPLSSGSHEGPDPAHPPERTIDAFQRLAARVTDALRDGVRVEEKAHYAFDEAATLLKGDRLRRLYRREDAYGRPLNKNTVDAYLPRLAQAYGVPTMQKDRRARALILLAAECRLAPLIEGNLAAIDWGPASTRTDLRGAFHLVSRWRWQNEPLILSRLAVCALTLDRPDEPHLPFRPITRLYEGVLAHHRPSGVREEEAKRLSVATTRILYTAYRLRSLKREIMQQLFQEAEALGIVEHRPPFDADPAARRRNVLTRLVLACELNHPPDSQTADLISLLHQEVSG